MTVALLIIIYLIFISLGLPDSILGSSFPAISENLGVTKELGGYIGMVVSVCTMTSSLLSPFLIKKFKTIGVVCASICLTVIGLVIVSFVKSDQIWAFFLAGIILGLGAGSIDNALNNYVALNYKAIHMNWLHCSWGVGASMGPLIIGSFINPEAQSAGWENGVRVLAAIQGTILLISLISIPFWNKVAIKNNYIEISDDKNEKTSKKYKELFKNPMLYFAILIFLAYCSLEQTTGLWIATYLHNVKHVDTQVSALLTSTFYIGITVGRFICGPLSLKLKEKFMNRLGIAIIGIGLILILLPLDTIFSLAGFVIIGLGCSPVYPGFMKLTPQFFGKSDSQFAMSMQSAGATLGCLIIPPLFGTIGKAINDFSFLPYYLLALFIILLVSAETQYKLVKKRNSKLSEEELNEFKVK